MSRLALAAAVLVLGCAGGLQAATYYVDKNAPNASDSNPGTEAEPWKTIAKANSTVAAGDTVYVKAGTYTQRVGPYASGTAAAPIAYRTFGDDTVVIGGNLEPGIYIFFKDYIIVDGFTTDGVNKHVWMIGSDHCTLQNLHCLDCTSSGGARSGIYLDDSHHNRILDCVVEFSGEGGDSLVLRRSNHNLVTGCSIIYGGHACFAIRGGSYNMIRDNYFTNPVQKIGEVYDICELGLGIMTERNVFQDNIFEYVPPLSPNAYSGIQYCGQDSIIRRNQFFDLEGPGISAGLWPGSQCPEGAPPEASRNYGNRIYHNVFYDDRRGGVWIGGTPTFEHTYEDNVYKNNIFYANSEYGNPYQIRAGRLNGYLFEHNNIIHDTPGEDVIYSSGLSAAHPLTWWESHYSDLYVDNMELAPQFVDAPNFDFHLAAGSPMIDAGTYLTEAFDQPGNQLYVLDPAYFFDGHDIEGEEGDWIRLDDGQIAQVVDVDYDSNILTLDREITCEPFTGVALTYEGAGPDMGVFEYSAPTVEVVGRYVFYNDSAFDGNDPAANSADDAAVASDKHALLPGGTATFANYTSYARGVNGIFVDVANLPGSPTVSDFTFKVGNDDTPGDWTVVSDPGISVSVRPGEGTDLSDRVTILFPDNLIEKQWLQVTVLATAATGLDSDDVFYFGNAIGETGNSASDAQVTPTDEIGVRDNPHTIDANPAAITSPYDFNRDRKVGPTDAILSRNNGTSSPDALQLITVPAP